MKRPLPAWSIIAAVAAALGFVAIFFVKNGTGEANRDELINVRNNQRKFSAGAPPSPNAPGGANDTSGHTQGYFRGQ